MARKAGCTSKRKSFTTKRGKKITFLAAVGETCVPAYDRPSAAQQKWRRNFTRAAKSCPAKPGPRRTACMAKELDLHHNNTARAHAGMAGYRRRHSRR